MAFFEGQVGLSFKGLEIPIDIEISGRACECQPGTFQPLAMSLTYSQAVRSALVIWRVWQLLIEVESDPASGSVDLNSARAVLNHEYDLFVSRYGVLNENQHLLKFDGTIDPRLGLLLALENVDPDTQTCEKAACFSERTYFPVQTVEGQIYFDEEVSDRLVKAYAYVLNECGEVDCDRIAELCGVTAEVAEQVLVDELELVMREPILPTGSGHRGSIGEAVDCA